jgi:hypothetical protein
MPPSLSDRQYCHPVVVSTIRGAQAELSDIEFLSWEAWQENTPLLDKMLKIKALDPGHQGFQVCLFCLTT